MQAFLAKLPPKEQLFFWLVLLLSLWMAYGVFSAWQANNVSVDTVRGRATEKAAAGGDVSALTRHVANAAKPMRDVRPEALDPLGLQARLESVHRSDDIRIPTNMFKSTADKVLPMYPIEIRGFRIPPVPGFVPAPGMSTPLSMQVRPVMIPRDPISISSETTSDFGSKIGE